MSTSFREFVSVKGGSEALGLLRFRVWKKGGSTWCVAAASLLLSRPSSCVVVRARVRVRESVYDFSTLHMHTVGMYV